MSDSSPTLLVPPKSRRATTSWGLPADLVQKAAGRLRAMSLLYATIFFFASFFPMFFFPTGHEHFASPINWLPGVLSIATALTVAGIVSRGTFTGARFAALAMTFEVVSSYGIAAAEFMSPEPLMIGPPWIGLSWVAPWILIFTVVVPSTPLGSLVSGLVAVTSVPVMIGIALRRYPIAIDPTPVEFFFTFVFPYFLVVSMAYVGARVVASLGHEVRKARELGSYQLLTPIGRGGMGEVWRAKHRLLARPAAIKLIRPPEATQGIAESARRRFEREAQSIASLRSPHTVNLFDFGVADDGTFFYVMELLEGLDADHFVRRFGPLPAERVVFVLKQICHSLSEAESIGLVHRDIKPANVFLCRYGEDYDFVKVLDFGIAKALSTPNNATIAATALTADQVIQGTPAFMAPEQALGADAVDGRVDIYSTGCLAYWLLTGELVFTGDTPLRVLLHHANTPVTPPSTRTELPIPPALDAVVMACLAKDPAARPQTARELAARLDAVPLAQKWTDASAREWWTMHRPTESEDLGLGTRG